MGSWEALAALLRVPWEVGLLVAQGCWIDGSRPAVRLVEAPQPREAQRLWAPGVSGTEKASLLP